jgi:transglutaminase-like putative cysteine protease
VAIAIPRWFGPAARRPAQPAGDGLRLGVGALCLLLVGLALATWPLVAMLPWWVLGVVLALGAWRLWAEWGGRRTTVGWLRLPFALGLVALLGATGHINWGVDGAAPMLVVFLWSKLLELRSLRDLLWCCFFAFVLAGVDLLPDQGLASAAASLSAVFCLVAAAVAAHGACPAAVDAVRPEAGMPGANRPTPVMVGSANAAVRPALRLALVLMVAAAPVTAVLFLLLPRPAMSMRPPMSRSGMSDQLEPGTVAALAKDQRMALRVTWTSGRPPTAAERYMRGVVLWETDGKRWWVGEARQLGRGANIRAKGESRPISYDVAVEAAGVTRRNWAFVLDPPSEAIQDATLEAGLVQVFRNRRTSYSAQSDLGMVANDTAWIPVAMQIPPADAAVQALAGQLAVPGRPAETLERLARHLATGGYMYTLNPGAMEDDPVRDVLITRKRGFCEHYATSCAVLLRLAGVPARVVVGYQGGEDNPYDDFTVMRNADAHAWLEAYVAGEGWRRFDPTAFLSTIESGTPAPASAGRGGGGATDDSDTDSGRASWWRKVSQSWDWVEWKWYRTVIDYDRERQRSWLASLGFSGVGGVALLAIALAAGLAIIVGTAWLLWRRARGPTDRGERLLTGLARAIRVPRRPDEGPVAWADRAGAIRPAAAADLRRAAEALAAWRYGRAPVAADLDRLRGLALAARASWRAAAAVEPLPT